MTDLNNTLRTLTDDARNALIDAVGNMFDEAGGDFCSYIGGTEIRDGEKLFARIPGDLIEAHYNTFNDGRRNQKCLQLAMCEALRDLGDFDAIVSAIKAAGADVPADVPAEDVSLGLPVNALTGKPYSGKNVGELLAAQAEGGFPTSEWLTFKQALAMGRCVRKGQKAAARIMKVVPKKDDDAKPAKGKKAKKVVKTYAVFNIAQTDALPAEKAEEKAA